MPALSAVLISAGIVRAVPPFGNVKTDFKTCRINPTAFKQRVAALRAARTIEGLGPYFPLPLSPTTSYVLVIRIDYTDQQMSKTLAQTQADFANLKTFYLENSFGLMAVSATVTNCITGGAGGCSPTGTGAYRMVAPLSSYANGIQSAYSTIAHDALNAANVDYNLAQAPGAPGGKAFDHILVYHAGVGSETCGTAGCQSSNIWSVFAPTEPAGSPLTNGVTVPFTADGVSFPGVSAIPEQENGSIQPFGVYCHEYGHQLGLPDLYDTDTGQSVVGKWSLMDAGAYLGSPLLGSNPAHLDAWSKQFLGFSQPQPIAPATAQSKTISNAAAQGSNKAFLRIPIDVSSVGGTNEYFLLEYRQGSGSSYDLSIPNHGLLIWHVDDSIASNQSRLDNNNVNTGSPNRGLTLISADGSDPSTNQGDSGDPWQDGATFALPQSSAFNGTPSGIVVSNLSGSGSGAMSMNITRLASASSVDIVKTITAPNPAGTGYTPMTRAAPGTLTTMIFQLTRPFKSAKLTIHELSGALVRNVPQTSLSLQAGPGLPSADYKWVYEYNWDGKNDDGESVASGVYLYRFKADDDAVKTGKLVVIR